MFGGGTGQGPGAGGLGMIEIEDLHKAFDGQEVLRGASLKVRQGELLALIGSSGGGKSVLLKHVAGLLRPDRGMVRVGGEDVARLRGSRLKALRGRLGFLFQGGALFDSLTVFENVAFPLREKTRLSLEAIEKRVLDELSQVGLSGSEHKYPSQISGGMIKRVSLARALVTEPELMLFDEPTTGLDPVRGLAILRLIASAHRRRGFTGMIVTHEIPRVFEFVDRVALLHEGRVLAQGPPLELLKSRDPAVQEFIAEPCRGLAMRGSRAAGGG